MGLIFRLSRLNTPDTSIVTRIITMATAEACAQSRRLMAYRYTLVERTCFSVAPNSWGVV